MNLSLAGFQDAFISALYGKDPETLPVLTEQSGFLVYRNTVMKGASDALLANFPTVERLVGTEWMQAAAARYVRLSPPTDARLLNYGKGFPDFLDAFEHARDLPYLGNVARLDLLWNEAHGAEDELALDVAAFAAIEPELLASVRLKLRATARWKWFATQPAYTIWRCNREQTDVPAELDWVGEGALISRSTGFITWYPLSVGECAFLDACAANLPLEDAAEHATQAEPDLDLMNMLSRLIAADVFAAH
ncbi:hypothetical protein M2401_003470 [Pseudomonas sp. JUb42]|jgi:hypothetical protein|uniref:HvfC/BufC N-terminal domain-containing protein n=1 Tax=Pseudomonas sp. JUb42 TaxID=2940611 RepID=UPI0021690F19|nr:DNA-binding domain-containing protein [Pseudomonas sp. JUb42]MCS3469730.1 hypothetical protein [Pseudomonas sp. JUb42]